MNEQLNDRLIRTLREEFPDGSDLAHFLMATLSLGKGAVYRRLRGEVIFTFEDVAKIARKLGLSSDKIIYESKGFENNQWAFFNTDSLLGPGYSTKYIDQFSKRMKILSGIVNNTQGAKASFRYATCNLPHYLTFSYKTLTTLRQYKRAYLAEGINPGFRLSDMSIPDELYATEKSFYKIFSSIPKQLLILDRKCFWVMVEDINYFYQRRLISDEEKRALKNDLLNVLLQLEKIAATGLYNDNVEVSLYLSDIQLESAYIHIEADNYQVALQLTYFIDFLSFYNSRVCQIQKEWIESLKRYSTLISQTGEMQRWNFFETQRNLIESSLS